MKMLSSAPWFWEDAQHLLFAAPKSTLPISSRFVGRAHVSYSGLQSNTFKQACPKKLMIMSMCDKCSSRLPYSLSATSIKSYSSDALFQAASTVDSNVDLRRVSTALRRLQDSGFYYDTITLSQAVKLLEKTPVGTFLVRDSADSRYLFALSVQTQRGPTHIRVHYVRGSFRLDAEDTLLDTMPTFDCVVALVEYYVQLSQTKKAKCHVWLDQSGRRDLHIRLTCPLYRRVSTLKHLCRTNVAKCTPVHLMEQLPVPKSVNQFLRDYPYTL